MRRSKRAHVQLKKKCATLHEELNEIETPGERLHSFCCSLKCNCIFRQEKRSCSMAIYKDGHGSHGHCWIEGNGVTFWVYVMDGRSKYGPYSSLNDAMSEFSKWCLA